MRAGIESICEVCRQSRNLEYSHPLSRYHPESSLPLTDPQWGTPCDLRGISLTAGRDSRPHTPERRYGQKMQNEPWISSNSFYSIRVRPKKRTRTDPTVHSLNPAP